MEEVDMALFTPAEFSLYVQTTVPDETANFLLDLVTGLVEEVDGHDYSTDTPSATAKAVALEASARAFRNPSGVSSRSEAMGNYSFTDRWDGVTAAELGLYLTGGETARLRGAPRNRSVVLQVP